MKTSNGDKWQNGEMNFLNVTLFKWTCVGLIFG